MSMIGKTLGNFTLESQIGKGGMGEVYQAKDQKLGRNVAIKVLPEEFARESDRVARFQREAKLLASLNHPNIAAIHGLEESEGTNFLVLELVAGDTLADRLKRGVIPVEESLKLALQIAEALEAAHENGVIHRDLKPANIKVTPEGKVKILDFGLAKAFAGEQKEIALSESPTLSVAATQQGIILGTAAYMSPEQAKGKSVNKQTDIWAFGAVLYEMLTGQAAFQGEDATEILASVVKASVNLNALSANIHFRIREILTRCLQKEQKRRYSRIADVQYEIEQVLADPSGVLLQSASETESKPKLRQMLVWIATTLVLTAIIVGAFVWNLRAPEPRQVTRFNYELGEGSIWFMAERGVVAVSPDGSSFVYATYDGLQHRKIDAFEAKLIPGLEDYLAANPFFSPDGQWVGFWNNGKLYKSAVSGGAPIPLADVVEAPYAMSWEMGDKILLAGPEGIQRLSADGGTPELLIEAKGNEQFDAPQLLPGGEWLLFTVGKPGNWDAAQIVVESLESGERKVVRSGGSDARYVKTGHLVYAFEDDLYAIHFDINALAGC